MCPLQSRRCPPTKNAVPPVSKGNATPAATKTSVVQQVGAIPVAALPSAVFPHLYSMLAVQNIPPANPNAHFGAQQSSSNFTPLGAESCGSLAALGLRNSAVGERPPQSLPPLAERDGNFYEELLLSDEQARIVIGKGGCNIQQIKFDGRVDAWVDIKRTVAGRKPLCIRGRALPQIGKAKQLVRDKLAEFGKPLVDDDVSGANYNHNLTIKCDSEGGGRSVHAMSQWQSEQRRVLIEQLSATASRPPIQVVTAAAAGSAQHVLQSIEIPAEKFVLVNGENGERLAQLRKELKVKLLASSVADPWNPVRLHINGFEDRVEAAKEQLEKILNGSDKRFGDSGRGSGKTTLPVADPAPPIPPPSGLWSVDVERETPSSVEFIDSGALSKSGQSSNSSISGVSLISDASPRMEQGCPEAKNDQEVEEKENERDESPGSGSQVEALLNVYSDQIEEVNKGVADLRVEIAQLKQDRAALTATSLQTNEGLAMVKKELASLRADLQTMKSNDSASSKLKLPMCQKCGMKRCEVLITPSNAKLICSPYCHDCKEE